MRSKLARPQPAFWQRFSRQRRSKRAKCDTIGNIISPVSLSERGTYAGTDNQLQY